jgi:hypothetical protein
MAERIVSPGVFTQERDQSFLAQGVAEIGAAFVGPTPDGPAFVPVVVQGQQQFETTFGVPDANSYVGYTVQNYLQEAGSATVVRVLGLSGYNSKGVYLYTSGSAGLKLLALLHPTTSGSLGSGIASVSVGGNTGSFSILISSSNASGPHISQSGINFVDNSGNPNYVGTVFGTAVNNPNSPIYTYAVFPNALEQAGSYTSPTNQLYAVTASINFTGVEYSNGSTPWIQSQPIAGETKNLFKIHTINDGEKANTRYKILITNVQKNIDGLSEYGTFGLQVCEYDDKTNNATVVTGGDFTVPPLTLDPSSPNYIARRIGNSEPTYNSETGETYYEGDFPNVSRLIRVEMAPDVAPTTAVPFGFAALFSSVSSSQSQLTSASYNISRYTDPSTGARGYTTTATGPDATYYGFDFTSRTARSLLAPVASTSLTVGSAFNLTSSLGATEYAGNRLSLEDTTSTAARYRSFAVPFQGGFSGLNPARQIAMGPAITNTNTQGFNLSSALSSGSAEYKRALRTLSNPDSVDMNLLVIPGVLYSQHSYIAQYAIDLCESRGDCFYIMDMDTLNASISTVASTARTLDTNYAATYYPWVRIQDTNTQTFIWAPPSVVLPEVYAYSDNVGAEWFAPAGLNRGGIPGAVGVKTRLTQMERDTLYESKVNPIAQFPGQGICVWGQKTLQRRSSALDRVNVRRLLITVKKFIASSARYLVFEQNTEATRNRFLNIVNPYLASIQQNSGLTAFRVVMDESNNTPDIIDRNILAGAIYLQPTRTAEFIKLDFNILPTGATFDTI